ncbi:16S rRNA (guanine(527)-N(7))-methyltransferase RsmG [Rhodoluna sp.]|uniref:16S rRNA (guanine(527)-N(7))-methyltransferase RsmG n=1 Tax=Rhodoluna sp. TaxID=1969481 RepID=UPI0025FE8C5F|nr:16S rRNA (guanine(527)-N(7))-methyltransferase RsmG [Rhodoluna sp.]
MNEQLENVPRETFSVEAEPAVAAAIFGAGIDQARGYAAALVRDGDELGLLGPREMPKLWTRHILNSAVVAELVADGKEVADVGSGAGLPGIPMAIAQPNAHFTLIEPMERRSNWLIEQVEALGLKNVRVLRARAEEVGDAFDIVTARAVSALPNLLKMTVPLTRHSGEIIALKGSKAAEEIEDSKRLQKKLDIQSFEIVFTGAEFLEEPTRVVRTRLV